MHVDSPIQAQGYPPVRTVPGYNYGTSAITHGVCVALFDGSSQSTAMAKAIEQALGIEVPDATNCTKIMGILEGGHDGRQVGAGETGRVVVAGLCQAKVRVPANTNLAIGTHLVPATVWDATNNVTIFGTSTAAANAGCLEPIVQASALQIAANPIAVLAEALTATGSDTIQTAWVDVLPDHKPLPFQASHTQLAIATLTDLLMHLCQGPAIIDRVTFQALDYGDTANTLADVEISPWGTATDQQSIYSVTPVLAHDASNGVIFGATVSLAGDTDTNVSLGTGGVAGTLKAANLRVCPSLAHVTLTIGQAASNGVNLKTTIYGRHL